MDEVEKPGTGLSRRRGPQSHVDEDGFQIIQGITEVTFTVRVGPHTSWTKVSGTNMEAAMKVVWREPDPRLGALQPSFLRLGALQFGLRNLNRVTSRSEYSFSTEPQ